MTGVTQGTQHTIFTKTVPKYHVNQEVLLNNRLTRYRISAPYRVETRIFYELCEIQGALFEESRLLPYQLEAA